MKKFVGFATNGEYSVGCTGQTVYLYDKNNNEIGKFKDIIYAYAPIISPDGKIFVVKSTVGRLAVYSLETFSLIKKFRFSKVDGAQDDGFCFSPDGRFFINIERHHDSLHSAISIYNTSAFSLVNQLLIGEDMMLDYIEYDETTSSYYVLGFVRGADAVIDHGFVGKFEGGKITNVTPISENEYEFYRSYKALETFGFTEKKHAWTYIDCELEKLKSMNHTLAKLFALKTSA
jgi:WD40 repeat protein